MKKLLVILVFFWSFLVSGCVEHKDINELDLVQGAVFDYNKHDQRYEVHVQIANNAAFNRGTTGGGQTQQTFFICDGAGNTVIEAIRDVSKNVNKRLFWSHCDVYIVGEELARRGIFPLIDFLMRDNEIREASLFFVSQAPLTELMSVKNVGAQVPLQTIKNMIDVGLSSHGTTFKKRIIELYQDLFTDNSCYVVPVVSVREPNKKSKGDIPKFHVSGAAVFKGDKMIGQLTPLEVRSYSFIANQIKDTVIPTMVQDKKETMEVIGSRAEIKPHIAGGRVSFTIKVKPRINYGEVAQPVNLADPGFARKTEQAFNETLRKELINSINRAKEMKADYFGLARQVQMADKELWKSVKDIWSEEVFPDVPINVEVDSKLIRTGLVISTKMEVGK
ncbi:germination protein, Ger(x)C family [Desulfotomaculum nigrificans CO-1-SRB]|uniref:Germination protein, Ger(X)C family n=1 Tax=Desulfotomaculum nigrificans (strain DSM 14880 / VKM B-2319 / CO-1-SRB) TaxID=868595 RepID=F6B8K8_DESCC|nr:Ger(x)C family spore germination protein [Desulfotomaculum nigrificans]AEF93580.1 germination protein, Ger(x)C family [Desulfotomaculum nigrificans CO-1-SRB]